MPKTIVSKFEIPNDPNLTTIKAFRIANKRAGEAKRLGPDGLENFLKYCNILTSLERQAEEAGFKIFIFKGKTGHTYAKDYKETPEEWNDYTAYQAWRAEQATAASQPEVPEHDDDPMASDEDNV